MSGRAKKSTHAKGGKKRQSSKVPVGTHLKEPVGVVGEPSDVSIMSEIHGPQVTVRRKSTESQATHFWDKIFYFSKNTRSLNWVQFMLNGKKVQNEMKRESLFG